jgi:hypothetical protein
MKFEVFLLETLPILSISIVDIDSFKVVDSVDMIDDVRGF